eukprot:TRINITY_DN179_c0_g1_i12.p1 TRINITY_DN179_c0_g1~~TRINITY_DN179_c0_g1_i12.p1  ORF type:complete len:735 (-),score=124.72 TRINITY_DN179_c0_g1_i12:1671-3578(-)
MKLAVIDKKLEELAKEKEALEKQKETVAVAADSLWPLPQEHPLVVGWRAFLAQPQDPQHFTVPQGVFGNCSSCDVYVRSCYSTFFDLIYNSSDQRCLILGTPGIGKTFFAYFLMREVVLRLKQEVMYQHRGGKSIIVFNPNGNVSILNEQIPLAQGHGWFIVDGVHPMDYVGPTVLVTSPNEAVYYTWQKQPSVVTFFMPLWTEAEVSACVQKLPPGTYDANLPPQVADVLPRAVGLKRFDVFGGVPRFLFGSSNMVLSGAHALKQAISVAKLCAFMKSTGLEAGRVSDRLVAINPAVNFQSYVVNFRSEFVSRELTTLFCQEEHAQLLSFLRGSAGNSSVAAIRGDLFEAEAHQRLCRGGKFVMRRVGTQTTEEVTLPKVATHVFEDLKNATVDADVYQKPTFRSLCAVDSFMVHNSRLLMFQMTVASEHSLKQKGLDAVVAQAKERFFKGKKVPATVYIVVPPDRFSSFTSVRAFPPSPSFWFFPSFLACTHTHSFPPPSLFLRVPPSCTVRLVLVKRVFHPSAFRLRGPLEQHEDADHGVRARVGDSERRREREVVCGNEPQQVDRVGLEQVAANTCVTKSVRSRTVSPSSASCASKNDAVSPPATQKVEDGGKQVTPRSGWHGSMCASQKR